MRAVDMGNRRCSITLWARCHFTAAWLHRCGHMSMVKTIILGKAKTPLLHTLPFVSMNNKCGQLTWPKALLGRCFRMFWSMTVTPWETE